MARLPHIKSVVIHRVGLQGRKLHLNRPPSPVPLSFPQRLAGRLNRRSISADQLERAAKRKEADDERSIQLGSSTYHTAKQATLHAAEKTWRLIRPNLQKKRMPSGVVIHARIYPRIQTMQRTSARLQLNRYSKPVGVHRSALGITAKIRVSGQAVAREQVTSVPSPTGITSKLRTSNPISVSTVSGSASPRSSVQKATSPVSRSTSTVRKPAALAASQPKAGYVSRIQTGRYVNTQSTGSVGKSSFSSFYRSQARIQQNKVEDSGMESIQAARVGYRKSVNTIQSAKNTAVAVRKTGRAARKIYAQTKTTVRQVRKASIIKKTPVINRIRESIENMKRMVKAIRMLTNPLALKLILAGAALLLLLMISGSVISIIGTAVDKPFSWLYQESKEPNSVLLNYSQDVKQNVTSLNQRMKDVLASGSNASQQSYSFTRGYKPHLENQGVEYTFLDPGSDDYINEIPYADLSAIAMVLRDRGNKEDYTNEDFDRALNTAFANFFTYEESLSTYYNNAHDHGVDEKGNPIPCPGHSSIQVYAANYTPEEVMNRLGFTQEEKDTSKQYQLAVASLMVPDVPGNILAQTPNSQGLISPAPYFSIITSPYGLRTDPLTGQQSFHSGVDLVGDSSKGVVTFQSPAVSAFDGIVTVAGYNNERGNNVTIEGKIGDRTIAASYLHFDLLKVEVGQSVKAGDVLGLVGSTGRSTGAHLHFELFVDQVRVDPWPYIQSN